MIRKSGILFTLAFSTFAAGFDSSMLTGCYIKTNDVAPSGHLVKVPEGVVWLFNFTQEESSLSVSSPEHSGCAISFTLSDLNESSSHLTFNQNNLDLDDHSEGFCYSMQEFRSNYLLHWDGYPHGGGQGIRITYLNYKNQRITSDWSRGACP